MFKNPLSFKGRIRRTEYGVSLIIYMFSHFICLIFIPHDLSILNIFLIPLTWFFFSQGAKRCHDIDNNGWWQLIPFYIFVLIFKDSINGKNKYGVNPKGINKQQNNIYSTTNTPTIGIADELRKMKELLDNNIISQEEYEKQKEKLLEK